MANVTARRRKTLRNRPPSAASRLRNTRAMFGNWNARFACIMLHAFLFTQSGVRSFIPGMRSAS